MDLMMGLPSNETLEISLIGTGGGYGESVVLHIGNSQWIVVDSCTDPTNGKCLPLEFLSMRGVNLANDVKLIICTHWHDDHIKGISEILRKCTSSNFSMAKANDINKFLRLVGLDSKLSQYEETESSFYEINECIEIIKERKLTVIRSGQDRTLYTHNENGINATIQSLSPSDKVMNDFDLEISTLITEFGASNRKIQTQSPNEKSVVLLINVNNHNVLLGADLEESSDPQKGWAAIVENSQCIKNIQSDFFKIPHHGSKTAYNKKVWDDLISSDSVACLTPCCRSKIPKEDMILKYLSHTDNLYSTSSIFNERARPKPREKRLQKAIQRFNPTVREIKFKYGVVIGSLDVSEQGGKWEVTTIGEAIKISNPQIDLRTIK